MTVWQRLRRRFRSRKARQEGYAAVLVGTLLASGVMFACAAIAVDESRWYAEGQRLQQAADAAALAGVPYMPYDFANAQKRAWDVAARNGYDHNASGVTVTVAQGPVLTQLVVTISSTISNTFGALIGTPTHTVTRSATADYKGPAPMGSPCNTFGNEPNSGGGGSSATPIGTAQGTSPFSNCSRTPQLWATIEGPETDKIQGDRYQTVNCTAGTDGCSGTTNSEYDDFGYVFIVKVQPAAVGSTVNLQLYDPEFGNTDSDCDLLPSSSSYPNDTNNLNPYVKDNDALNRYSDDGTTSASFCPGDSYPGLDTTTPNALTTSFVLRQQTDSQDPEQAPVQNGTDGNACIKQYGTYSTTYSTRNGAFNSWNANLFKSGAGAYNAGLSQLFHNWVSFCSFVPQRAGDYYLQVRTNVSMGGTATTNPMVKTGNTAADDPSGNTTSGEGANSFSIRAVTATGLENQVAVSGYSHMPIYMNADTSSATFNLIRVLPAAAGQYIQFSFFDAGDATGRGDIKVLIPGDATGSVRTTPFPGSCQAAGGAAGGGSVLSNCDAVISNSTNNGKTETISIPIPSDYSCNATSLGGCWYQVQVTFTPQGNQDPSVHDTTTWTATVVGDPVRLIH